MPLAGVHLFVADGGVFEARRSRMGQRLPDKQPGSR